MTRQFYSISIWGSCQHICRVWSPSLLLPGATNTLLSLDMFPVLLALQLAICLFLFFADIDAVYRGMQVSTSKTCSAFPFHARYFAGPLPKHIEQ